MKKIFILVFPILAYILIGSMTTKAVKIPDEAIRIRILANSNSENDQQIKYEVKNQVEPFLYDLLKDTKNVTEAKQIINTNLNNLDNLVSDTLNGQETYKINFGKNYFPSKEYKGITYDEGYYDSVLITLGNGLGDNWWCVLFPPICMLEATSSDDVTYTTFVGELINEYFK